MALLISSFLCYNTLIILFCFLCFPLFSSPVSARLNQHHLPDHARGMLTEMKSRLGSTPPSCYNKCKQCHPCTAVQVPSTPNLHRVEHRPSSTVAVAGYEIDPSSWDDRYPNYKPLDWKCRCKDHLYNPF